MAYGLPLRWSGRQSPLRVLWMARVLSTGGWLGLSSRRGSRARSLTMTSLRSLGDLLAIVPYMLGFHPADSVVLFGVRTKKIIFQVRGDLPSPDDVPESARYYADLLVRQGAGAAIGLGDGAGPRSGER